MGCGKIRHLGTKFLRVQEKVREKIIKIAKCSTDTNVADIHTKPLAATRYFMLMAMLPFRVPASGCTTAHAIVVASMCMQMVEGRKSTAVTTYNHFDDSGFRWAWMPVVTVLSLLTMTIMMCSSIYQCRRRAKLAETTTHTDNICEVAYCELSVIDLKTCA